MSSDGLSVAAHATQRGDEVGEALEGEVLAVERNQHRVGGDERVEREQSERRRRVDEDDSRTSHAAAQEALEPVFTFGESDELDLGAGEVSDRRESATGP